MPECLLVRDRRPNARIVLQEPSRRAAQEAAMELVHGVALATGARLFIDGSDVFEDPLEPRRQTPVRIRFNLLPRSMNCLTKDTFRVCVTSDSLDISAETPAGFLNAVYGLLEQYCGFVWLWPGPDGEACKSLDSLAIPVGEWSDGPDYLWRHLLFADIDPAHESKWTIKEFHLHPDAAAMADFHRWQQRNRLGGLKVYMGHTWGELVSPLVYGRTHPEFFAEINGSREAGLANFTGKHGGQLCTTNPQLLDMFVEKVRAFFDAHPDYDVMSISPNDGTGFCECDRCIALDVACGNPPPQAVRTAGGALESTFKDDADKTGPAMRITGPITDRIFTFANHVAARIAESHPDKLLLLLVYSVYRDPPRKIKLAPNVIAWFCVQCHQHWDDGFRQADFDNVATLAKNADELGIYDYYDQGAWPGVVRSFPDLIAGSVREFHRRGAAHYSTQASTGFATNAFNLWFLSRVLWNTASDVDAELDRFCASAFGAAAAAMTDYFNLWRTRWKETKGMAGTGDSMGEKTDQSKRLTPFDQVRRLYPADFLTTCRQTLDRARSQVDPLSAQRRRIDFVEQGLRTTELAVQAASASYALAEKGWPMTCGDVTPEAVQRLGDPAAVRRIALAALEHWDRWEAWLETHRNGFVLSHFWARYCLDSRKGLHPHQALRRILELLPAG